MHRIILTIALASALPAAHAAERVYFTSDRASASGKPQTQVFSMNPDGGDVRQLTTSPGTKAGVYRCGAAVFFQNEDALAQLAASAEEETYLSAKGTQYHTPRCSSDARYLSVTAWDKARKVGYIEVYERATKQRVARWEGEEASWMRGRHALIYKLFVPRNEDEARIGILTRDVDEPAAAPQELYHADVGEYVYNLTDPQFVGPGAKDFVFRIYDEHEYFYYLEDLGKSFVLTRDKKALSHHNAYAGEFGDAREQGQLTLAPDGKHAVFNENPWNTPPSLYLLDLATRDSRKIAEGFNPVWSQDSSRIYFNKDPAFFARYHDAARRSEEFGEVFPKQLDGYEIYVYDLSRKTETRLTNNRVYDGFL